MSDLNGLFKTVVPEKLEENVCPWQVPSLYHSVNTYTFLLVCVMRRIDREISNFDSEEGCGAREHRKRSFQRVQEALKRWMYPGIRVIQKAASIYFHLKSFH